MSNLLIYFLRAGKLRTLENQSLLRAASTMNFFGKTTFNIPFYILEFFQLFLASKISFNFSLPNESTPNQGPTVNHTLEKEKLPVFGMQELTTSYQDVMVAVDLKIVTAVFLVVIYDLSQQFVPKDLIWVISQIIINDLLYSPSLNSKKFMKK